MTTRADKGYDERDYVTFEPMQREDDGTYTAAEASFSAALIALWNEADARDDDALAELCKAGLSAARLPWVSIKAGARRPRGVGE